MSRTRRQFLKEAATASAAFSVVPMTVTPAADQPQRSRGALPWYRRAYRWGQTNITENDPVRYDIAWWRAHWKRTAVQGVIINAGGIVAYYPSKFPLHHRAEFLDGRDLFGELTKAAHDDGLFVMARMDSNRTAEDFFKAHPDWFARDARRQAVSRGRQVHHLHQQPVLRRVPARRPARDHRALAPRRLHRQQLGGLGRESICYCDNCDAQVPGEDRARRCRARPTGTTRPTASGSCGTTRGGSRSGS